MVDRLPNKSHLERLITANSDDSTKSVARLRRWISTMILIKAFERVVNEINGPIFVIKGGVAMELRLGLAARMTNDIDATFYGKSEEVEAALQLAFAESVSGFTIDALPLEPIGRTGAVRTTVRLRYQLRPWGSINLEMAIGVPPAEVELVPAIDISTFGLVGPDRVAALPVRLQLAQKFHAVSQQFPTGENKRVRDIVDILLLRDLVDDVARLRTECLNLFEARATHEWPPTITIYDSWAAEHVRLCTAINFATHDIEEAVEEVNRFIAEIDAAR